VITATGRLSDLNGFSAGAKVQFRLLGPMEVATSGQPVEVGPPQRCAVLAALAVDAGRPVTVETLIDRGLG